MAKLIAPFTPFIADEIYDNLDGAEPSVHLCDFPVAGERDPSWSRRWRWPGRRSASASPPAVRPSSRSASRCGPRWWSPPAASARRSSGWPTWCARSSTSASCGSSPQADELGQVELKPNYRTLGPRFGKQMPLVAAAVAGLDAAHAAAALRDGQSVAISVAGTDHELGADDLLVSMKPLEGYQVEREGSHAVALELEIDDELRAEGWARDIVRAVQNARQDAGLRSRSDRADARWRRAADRRRAIPPGLHRRRDAGHRGQLRVVWTARAACDRRAAAEDRRRPASADQGLMPQRSE